MKTWKLHRVHNKLSLIEFPFWKWFLKKTPTKMFSNDLWEIFHFSPLILESLVFFYKILAFFLGVRLKQKNMFKEIIYFELMFEKFLQQTKSAVIRRYKIFFLFSSLISSYPGIREIYFLLRLDQQSSKNVCGGIRHFGFSSLESFLLKYKNFLSL